MRRKHAADVFSGTRYTYHDMRLDFKNLPLLDPSGDEDWVDPLVGTHAIFDLSGVSKTLKRKEGKLVLCSLHHFVKEIFEVSGFDSLIPVQDTVESGIELLDAN
jgi:hypothetical protein